VITRLQERIAVGRDGKPHSVFHLTIPAVIVYELNAKKGDKFEFFYNEMHGVITAQKVHT
jgi:hypothetical protein